MVKKSQVAGQCVFCGGCGLTKEHIWSDWLTKRKVVPEQSTHQQMTTHVNVDHVNDVVAIMPTLKKPRMGPLIQEKVRRVCRNCNGGWMRNIVDAAIPFAEPMIIGSMIMVTPEVQRALSAWIGLSCIMAEFSDDRSRAVPLVDRVYIRENGEPPSDWHIFIGRYGGTQWAPTRYRHHGWQFARVPHGTTDISNAEHHSWQASTYVLGTFAVHAFSSTFAPLTDVFEAKFVPEAMERIWPIRATFAWPILSLLGDGEMNVVADDYFDRGETAFRDG